MSMMKWENIINGIVGIFLLQAGMQLVGCGSEDPKPVALKVTTSPVSSTTETGASSGGTIVSDGEGPITAAGVCWGT